MARRVPITSTTSMIAINEIPRMSVQRDMMSSKLALPLNVVRTPPPPDIASPFPVNRTRAENRRATTRPNPMSTS